ncbi:MAG: ABC transporter permease [Deltaproteobacteria bacterium]|nr:ABC transporter permease [Deltaproteobacteria bacterium]
MSYSLQIGVRYLRSKKRATVSMITLISIIGVALGVAALLAVLSITTGFEQAFRDKVLGVNAHVLVLKYGREFRDYRDVLATVGEMEGVAGIAPFSINEMMLTKGERRAVVLVKGVTPEGLQTVLDLPNQMIAGDLRGLRRPGSTPTAALRPPESGDTWQWLRDLRDGTETANRDETEPRDTPSASDDAPGLRKTVWEEEAERRAAQRQAARQARRPHIGKVAEPGDIEAILGGLDDDELALPDDPAWEAGLSQGQAQEPVDSLAGIIVGKTLAEDLDVEVGDRVRLISPLAALGLALSEPGGASTRSREFRVIGVFQAGFQEYDSGLVYTDLFEAQRLFDEGDNVTGVEGTSSQLARRIEQNLGGAFHSLDWSELNRNLFTALAVQKIALTLVIATIIFVAAHPDHDRHREEARDRDPEGDGCHRRHDPRRVHAAGRRRRRNRNVGGRPLRRRPGPVLRQDPFPARPQGLPHRPPTGRARPLRFPHHHRNRTPDLHHLDHRPLLVGRPNAPR